MKMIFGPYKHQALTVPTPILLCSHSHSDPYSNPVPIPVGIPWESHFHGYFPRTPLACIGYVTTLTHVGLYAYFIL